MTDNRRERKGGVKWTDEICAWLKERCPAAEHGYTSRREILDDLNATFGTDFSMNAFVGHVYEGRYRLGFVSDSAIMRGESHWRHKPVGSLQEKKGYLRIKVAEPNTWMQYQRFVWEKSHPGKSAAGAVVIFMDGDNQNFMPENLERVSRGELCTMAKLGHTKDMTREERELCLLRARIAIAAGKLVGRERAMQIRTSKWYALKKRRHQVPLENARDV